MVTLKKPQEIISNNHFFISQEDLLKELEKNNVTPHLEEAFRLYKNKK